MLTELPLVLCLGPQEDLGPSNVAPGRWPTRVGLNSGEARRSVAGEGCGEGLGSSVTGLWPKLGLGRLRRWDATTADVGGHGSSGSGELSAGAREWAARTALLGPRGGAGGVNRQWRRVKRRRARGGAPGAVASTGPARGGPVFALNSRGGSLPSRRSKGPGLTPLYGV
jgi:hypothetical protein